MTPNPQRYYKNFMHGMRRPGKALMAAVSRLSRYPVVGGLGIRWKPEGIEIDSYLELRDPEQVAAFSAAVNAVVTLARALEREGVFKCVMFDAKHTLHLERAGEGEPFEVPPDLRIPYEVVPPESAEPRLHPHSYFEDGRDPDEYLPLPQAIIDAVAALNNIPHTGCVIFESKPTHLKIHSYYILLAPEREAEFAALLEQIVSAADQIRGLGIAGFMKLPCERTRHFERRRRLPERFYPSDHAARRKTPGRCPLRCSCLARRPAKWPRRCAEQQVEPRGSESPELVGLPDQGMMARVEQLGQARRRASRSAPRHF
ncbi:MAG: hypothetical protein U5L11_06815 [Arhodomonas sp.]|nr:hypothetical protein [Arhodomonas sp.]